MIPIVKAVIPAAGLGTRLLPLTKALPKEMLPVGRKPVIHYVAEELLRAEITQVMTVTCRQKRAIEDHLDIDNSLSGEALKDFKFLEGKLRFFYTRQDIPRGLGHAVSLCEDFTGGEDFAVALGDSIIDAKDNEELLPEMLKFHRESGASATIAVEEVSPAETFRYGIADIGHKGPPGSGRAAVMADIVEKPSPENSPGCLAVAARYVFSPHIFEALKKSRPGRNGEIQLTDAIRLLIGMGRPVYAWPLSANQRRYDIGNFESYFRAFIDFSLSDSRYGNSVRKYIKDLAGKI